MNIIKTESHLASLQLKKETLDTAIHVEEKRPVSDAARIYDLKRQKLKLKDEIAQFQEAS